MSEAFEVIRDRAAEQGLAIRDVKQNHFMAQCPAHEDKNPSLGVDDKGDRVMLRCYAGCHNDDVVAALGLEMKDLFDGEPSHDRAIPVRSYVYERPGGEPWLIVDRYYPKTFIQRLPGTEAGDRSGIRGRDPILYHVPKVQRALNTGEAVVWLVEGEKDVETAERQGLVATTAPGGAGRRWDPRYSQFLRRAREVVIVVDQDKIKDNGDLGVGQQYGLAARASLRSVGVAVRVVAPAVGKDLTDHFAGGYKAEDFVPETTAYVRPRGMRADALATADFKPISWAVAGVLPAGLAVMAAPPKIGKSWTALDLCLAVASGGRAFGGQVPAELGSALYLAREDNYRRLQSRIGYLMGGDPTPGKLEVVPSEVDWPGGEQGLSNLTEWAEEVRDARLVVIDTLAKLEPDFGQVAGARSGNAYNANYSMMARYKNWADAHNCAVLMIHHDSKPTGQKGAQKWTHETGEDPFTRISGTRAIIGAADTLWFFETFRGALKGYLHVTGRDVTQQSLEFQRTGAQWTCLDQPEGV